MGMGNLQPATAVPNDGAEIHGSVHGVRHSYRQGPTDHRRVYEQLVSKEFCADRRSCRVGE